MNDSTPPWLMLVTTLTGDNKTARMRIWRALKGSGAGALRDGVYVLPRSPEAHAVFAEQAQEIVEAGGTAYVLSFDSDSDEQETEFQALFDRSAEYANLLSKIGQFRVAARKLDEGEARRQLGALQRAAAALVEMDFFPNPARPQIGAALADASAAILARFSPDEPHTLSGSVPLREAKKYRGRTWATREHLWVDRVASAWLIRRFIDRKARFVWLKKPKDCPKAAVGFDFDGAEFSHLGARVTFEVLATSFGLDRDPAIVRLGALVHYLDVGGVVVAEAAGFSTILSGARAMQATDDLLLRNMSIVFDALYRGFTESSGGVP